MVGEEASGVQRVMNSSARSATSSRPADNPLALGDIDS
jgi:hypothetical protein